MEREPTDACRHVIESRAELSPVAAIVGGILAAEILKAISVGGPDRLYLLMNLH